MTVTDTDTDPCTGCARLIVDAGPIGACQSCRHALASLPGEDNQPVPHDGRDPRGRCGLPSHSLATFVAHAEPRMDLPVNACWEPRRG